MSKEDKDFDQFIMVLKVMGLINPEVLGISGALAGIKSVMKASPNEFRLMQFVIPDKKTVELYKIMREAYEYYLLYGGMVLERAEEFRDRYLDIMEGNCDLV